jgi:Family of unknown function (DUF6130)
VRDTYKAVELHEPGRLWVAEWSVSEPGTGEVKSPISQEIKQHPRGFLGSGARSIKRIMITVLVAGAGFMAAWVAAAQSVRQAAPVVPIKNEPPARIIVDPPLAEPLSFGRVVIQYRTEKLHSVPMFGPAALAVSPRVGHIHVAVDDATRVWADASGEPVILNGFPAGPHKVRIELENANHQPIDQATVQVTVATAKP